MVLTRPEAYASALLAMFFWASWPNFAKMSKVPWGVQFRWQCIGTVLVLVTASGVRCSCSSGRWFDSGPVVFLMSVASGFVCGTGVMTQVAAIALDGVVLAIPVSNGLGTVLGTVLLYVIEIGSRETDPGMLFAGVGCVLAAICLNGASPAFDDPPPVEGVAASPLLPDGPETKDSLQATLPPRSEEETVYQKPLDDRGGVAPPSSSSSCLDVACRPGLLFAVAAGICFAGWPLLEELTILYFDAHLFCDVLVPFAVGFVVAMTFLLPWLADDLRAVPTPRDIACAVAAGAVWALGVVCLLLAGIRLGDAVAVAIAQCNPMIATLYGIFLWDELPASTSRNKVIAVVTSLFLFLVGIVFFILAT